MLWMNQTSQWNIGIEKRTLEAKSKVDSKPKSKGGGEGESFLSPSKVRFKMTQIVCINSLNDGCDIN